MYNYTALVIEFALDLLRHSGAHVHRQGVQVLAELPGSNGGGVLAELERCRWSAQLARLLVHVVLKVLEDSGQVFESSLPMLAGLLARLLVWLKPHRTAR